MRSGDVFGLGDGGVGEFVGGGGTFGYRGSTNEYSEASSDGNSSLDSASDDSDVRDGDVARLVVKEVVAYWVIVSARGRAMNRPYRRG
jgi:hypothetical protein